MKKLTASLMLAAVALSASAQKNIIKTPQNPVFSEWEAKPSPHPLPPEYAGLDAYYVLNSVKIDHKIEGSGLTTYYTRHEIVKVLGDRGIETFNKIHRPVRRYAKILSIQARTILANGKVYDIPRKMIKTTIDESGTYEIDIALEGVEKNAEIELLVKEIWQGSGFASMTMQYPIPVQHTFFEMNYPKMLEYEQKGYNGFPDLKDTLLHNQKRRQMAVYIPDMPALKREPYSFYTLNAQRNEYRLSYVYEEGGEHIRLNSWDDFVREKHQDIYTLTAKDKAAANKFISTLGITNKGNDWDNVRKIENGIKNGIHLFHYDYNKNDDLDTVITKKAATTSGYLKLFAACLMLANVDHQFVFATDKTEHLLDTKFENWINIDHYLIYFPTLNKYMDPLDLYVRAPMIPSGAAGHKALFCDIPPNGKLTGQVSEVRKIPILPAADNKIAVSANIRLDSNMDALVNVNYAYTGYTGTDARTNMVMLTGKNKTESVEKLITIAEKPEDIVKYTLSNESFDNYNSNKPLEITATVKAPHLVEKAGKNYLVKLGDIIDDNVELYKDVPRVMPVDLPYPSTYTHTITLTIPKGYKVLNPEAMRIQSDYVDANGKAIMGFKSDYSIAGNILTVKVNEFYNQTHYALSDYERFRGVVNAAADFGKVTLVLGKKI